MGLLEIVVVMLVLLSWISTIYSLEVLVSITSVHFLTDSDSCCTYIVVGSTFA